jgi:hypothetical protein
MAKKDKRFRGSHDESVSTGMYDYLDSGPARFREYSVSPKRPAQDVFKGKDISARVERGASSVSLLPVVDPSVRGGYSGEVSRGTRPVHKAGKRSYKRV